MNNQDLNLTQYLRESQETPQLSQETDEDIISVVSPKLAESEETDQLDLTRYLRDEQQPEISDEKGAFFETGRALGRAGSRIAETILGSLGDIRDLSEIGGQFLGEKIGRGARKLAGKRELTENEINDIRSQISENPGLFGKISKLLPSSQDLKSFSEAYTDGFTAPQGYWEEFGDDVLSLGTSLLMGAKDPTKFKNLAKAVFKSSTAKGAGLAAEGLGATPETKNKVEMGTLILSSLLNRRLANETISSRYKAANEALKDKPVIGVSKLEKDVSKLQEQFSKGLKGQSEVKKTALNTLEELENKIASGYVEVEELKEAYKDINEKMRSKKLFADLASGEKKQMRKALSEVNSKIYDQLEEYGKNNPDFWKNWTEANQANAALSSSKNIVEFLKRNTKGLPGHVATGVALKLFLGAPTVGAVAGGLAAFKVGQALHRISTNSVLRKHYLDVIKNASKENLTATANSLSKLQDELDKKPKR